MARSKWKNKFFNKDTWSKIFSNKYSRLFKNFKKVFFSRSSSVPTSLINTKVFIHKGKITNKVLLTKNHIGYKFGEFSYSRKPFFFLKKPSKR